MEKRIQYLQSQWPKYPAWKNENSLFGRIYEIQSESLTLARFHKSWIWHEVSLHQLALKNSLFSVKDVVRVGDLVALSADQKELILLAPAESDPAGPWRESDWLKAQKKAEVARQWDLFLRHVRSFFQQKDFIEIQTPLLVECPGTEPSLEVFETKLQIGAKSKRLFLPTSPEIHLKKTLGLGLENIFEITSSFRNGEITERHQPEFKILEWYRAYSDLYSIKADVQELIQWLCQNFSQSPPLAVRTFSITELFKTHCDFDLRSDTSEVELRQLAQRLSIDVRSATCIDDVFYLIFTEAIENKWSQDELVFVEGYPPYQAALARLDDSGFALRFEAYWRGLELANAFYELTDPVVQRQRSGEDLIKKKEMGKSEISLDEGFFVCLERGLPPTSGIALGLERLFMSLFAVSKIDQVKLFSY